MRISFQGIDLADVTEIEFDSYSGPPEPYATLHTMTSKPIVVRGAAYEALVAALRAYGATR